MIDSKHLRDLTVSAAHCEHCPRADQLYRVTYTGGERAEVLLLCPNHLTLSTQTIPKTDKDPA